MRFARFAPVLYVLALVKIAAAADDSAGVQVLIDMQDPTAISKSFCVHDSKLYSTDALICMSTSVSLTCKQIDPNDATKGLKWVAADEKTRCHP